MDKCVNCGADKVVDVPECPHCRAIYARAEAIYQRRRTKVTPTPAVKLTPCPTCGKEISKNAPTCPHCGEVINPVSAKNNKTQVIGYLGAATMAIGVFCPLVSLPIVGSINFFSNGKGDGTALLLFAVISIAGVFWKRYKLLFLAGSASLALLAFDFWHFFSRMSEAHAKMKSEMVGNPFEGIAMAAAQSVQIQWGWAVMIVGAAMLIAAGIIHNQEEQKRS